MRFTLTSYFKKMSNSWKMTKKLKEWKNRGRTLGGVWGMSGEHVFPLKTEEEEEERWWFNAVSAERRHVALQRQSHCEVFMILYGEVTTFHKEIIIMSEPLEVMKVSRLIMLVPLICHSVLQFLCVLWMQHDLHTLPSPPLCLSARTLLQNLKVFIVSHIFVCVCGQAVFLNFQRTAHKYTKVG